MSYIAKVDSRELYDDGIGKVDLWDFSSADLNEESRIEAVSKIASICYSKPPRDAKKLIKRLWTESGGLPSSAFEFLRWGGAISGIDKSLRNNPEMPTFEEIPSEASPTMSHQMDIDMAIINHEESIATFRLKVPIFIRSQIVRHRSYSLQELSRRYTTDKQAPVEFFVPPHSKIHPKARAVFMDSYAMSYAAYKDLLDTGVRPEVARGVLPQSLYTEFWLMGNVPALKNYFALRTYESAQLEHRMVAEAMLDLLKEHQPELWKKVKP